MSLDRPFVPELEGEEPVTLTVDEHMALRSVAVMLHQVGNQLGATGFTWNEAEAGAQDLTPTKLVALVEATVQAEAEARAYTPAEHARLSWLVASALCINGIPIDELQKAVVTTHSSHAR